MGNFKLNMNGANRTISFDPKIDQITTCDLANLVLPSGIYFGQMGIKDK